MDPELRGEVEAMIASNAQLGADLKAAIDGHRVCLQELERCVEAEAVPFPRDARHLKAAQDGHRASIQHLTGLLEDVQQRSERARAMLAQVQAVH
jgi:hypothetical protein